MPPPRHGHFHQILILPVKIVELPQLHKPYCKPYHYQFLQNLHLKCGRVPRSVFANLAMHENQFGFVWKPVFFSIISKCYQLYRKSMCFSVTFLQYDEVFLISLLDGCYHYLIFMDKANGSKSKLLVKDYISLKSKIRFGYVSL